MSEFENENRFLHQRDYLKYLDDLKKLSLQPLDFLRLFFKLHVFSTSVFVRLFSKPHYF